MSWLASASKPVLDHRILLLPAEVLTPIAINLPSVNPVWSLGLLQDVLGLVILFVTAYSAFTRIPAGPKLQSVSVPSCGS